MRFFLAIIISLLVAACSNVPPPAPTNLLWEKHQKQIAQLTDWQANGKIAITTAQEKNSGNLLWRDHDGDYEIILSSILGTRVFSISNDQDIVTVEVRGKRYLTRDPKALLSKMTGYALPIDQLKYWLRGIPAPNDDATLTFNDNQLLATITTQTDAQNQPTPASWQISYQQYSQTNNVWLPSKIEVKQDDIHLKLAIKKWQISSSTATAD